MTMANLKPICPTDTPIESTAIHVVAGRRMLVMVMGYKVCKTGHKALIQHLDEDGELYSVNDRPGWMKNKDGTAVRSVSIKELFKPTDRFEFKLQR